MVNLPIKKNLTYSFPRARSIKKFIWQKLHTPTNWPPKDSSPLHPIEPWGRQFFVFNANETDETKWDQGGFWSPPPPKQGAENKPIPNQTVLCVTDYRKRPYMYLDMSDLQTLINNFSFIDNEFEKFKEELENSKVHDSRWENQRLLLPKRSFHMQRTQKGEHKNWVLFKSRPRERKT